MISKLKVGLSIDGGGVMGIGPLKFLANFERDTGITPNELFDYYAGTSVGSLLVYLLYKYNSANYVYEYFLENANKIFTKTTFYKNIIHFFGSKYSNENLIKILNQECGDLKLDELEKPFYIAATKLDSFEAAIFSQEDTPETPVKFALQASAAAPTFFQPIDGYVDGGLWANNPTLFSSILFKNRFNLNFSNMAVVSFGTSGIINTYDQQLKNANRWSLLRWAVPIIQYSIKSNEDYNHYIMSNLNWGGYVRFVPELNKPFVLDSMKTLRDYPKVWDDYYNTNKENIIKYLTYIKGE